MILGTPYRSTLRGLGDSTIPDCSTVTVACGAVGPVNCNGLQSDVQTTCPAGSLWLGGATLPPTTTTGTCNLGGFMGGISNAFSSTAGIMAVMSNMSAFSCDSGYLAGVLAVPVVGVVALLSLMGGAGGYRRR